MIGIYAKAERGKDNEREGKEKKGQEKKGRKEGIMFLFHILVFSFYISC